MPNRQKSSRVLASCHDLGGANQIIYSTLYTGTHYLLTGPALTIAENLNLPNVLSTRDLDLSEFDLVIVGSNVEYQLSDELLKYFKNLGVLTVGYLDHWVNYKTRWATAPDKIVVTDWFAFINAFLAFGFRVRKHPNRYLKFLKTKYYLEKNRTGPSQALFLVQPFEDGYLHESGFEICVCKYVHTFLSKRSVRRVRIRDHATTNSNECIISLEKSFENVIFSKSSWDQPLENDIFESDFILGRDTYAMYIAKKLGKCVLTLGERRAWLSPIYKRL